MLTAVIKSILTKEYKGYKIYLHNMSNFDGIFLLKIMKNIGHVSPVINKGKIISIDIVGNDSRLTFYDSYQLLPASLTKLAISFGVENKGIFPYKFLINTATALNYKGPIPEFKYFNNISEQEYLDYCKSFNRNVIWDLRKETFKYCLQDCISLFEVISKFNSMIFSLFQLNIVDYPTLPSLSFSIYKTRYMKKDVIAKISGKIDKDIRKS